jgi:hypothetical protein
MSTRPAAPAVDTPMNPPNEQGEIEIVPGKLTKRIVEQGHGPTPTHRADVTG